MSGECVSTRSQKHMNIDSGVVIHLPLPMIDCLHSCETPSSSCFLQGPQDTWNGTPQTHKSTLWKNLPNLMSGHSKWALCLQRFFQKCYRNFIWSSLLDLQTRFQGDDSWNLWLLSCRSFAVTVLCFSLWRFLFFVIRKLAKILNYFFFLCVRACSRIWQFSHSDTYFNLHNNVTGKIKLHKQMLRTK